MGGGVASTNFSQNLRGQAVKKESGLQARLGMGATGAEAPTLDFVEFNTLLAPEGQRKSILGIARGRTR